MDVHRQNPPTRVLDVGNCNHDHSLIRRMLEAHFRATVDRAHVLDDAIDTIRKNQYDLVLVNRVLDRDRTEGLNIIRQMKTDDRIKDIPVMLVSNYPDAQDAAVAAGALRGFGKAELDSDTALARLREILA